MASFIGSVWAVIAAGALGYIAGHLFPISKLVSWIR